MGKKLNFYFDFLSPYSYLAWMKIRDYNEEMDFYPVPLSKIIKFYETKGPAEIAPKREFLMKDLIRKCILENIPFQPPKQLPFNSLYALRICLKGVSGNLQRELIDLFFQSSWGQGKDIDSEESIQKLFFEADRDDFVDLLARSMSKEARIEMKTNISCALDKGAFGVPTFVVDDELFWGVESIDNLRLYLDGKDPLSLEQYEYFLNRYQN